MRTHAARIALALVAAGTLTVSGCSGGGSGKDAKPKPSAKDTAAGQGVVQPTINMPDLVGKDLAAATEAVKAAGFADIGFHDALGQNRTPAGDTKWKVCDQSPKPGPSSPKDKVDLGAVLTKETCSGAPTAKPTQPDTPAPPSPTRTTAQPTRDPGDPFPFPTGKPTKPGGGFPTFVFYRTCAEAKAAGAAPLYEGQPGYSRHLDRDGDGIACDK
ncbi:excalibur calcium-binding domain-containing protein [Yinghuangia seranimata]|uniref:excalibur calcium-binding domain-containing protein n=1 Tax=Yinghuangia seranimata TaxID=408067 RepID=UPI00248B20A8|nr:excalibur calcium-binding domain-containing protein [Yinghuangia seranimata]MDI2124920.1 excalibur calcium-binding domain-containing protein [Yinghuangia seranimata]